MFVHWSIISLSFNNHFWIYAFEQSILSTSSRLSPFYPIPYSSTCTKLKDFRHSIPNRSNTIHNKKFHISTSSSSSTNLMMCQLLGMNSARPTDCIFSFRGFALRGGETDKHSDGWGLSFYEGRGIRSFLDPLPAAHSPIAKFMTDYPIKTHNMIAHIRYATSGTVSLENVHPFQRELVRQFYIILFCFVLFYFILFYFNDF